MTTGATPGQASPSSHAAKGRRTRRSRRRTGAVVLLCVATVLVVAAVVVDTALAPPLLVALSAVVAVVLGWASYRLLRAEVVATRRECALERSDLARSYRDLFDRRADEVTAQQRRTSVRLAQQERTVTRLREALASAEQRADGAERTLADVRRRLAEAEERFAAMASTDPASGPEPGRDEDAQARVVPEWAELEDDPMRALLAWEEHAARRTEVPEERRHA